MKFLGKKGQGAFEYVLILAGVLLIVVLAIVILRGGLVGNQSTISYNECKTQLASWQGCYTGGVWNNASVVTEAEYTADPGLAACKAYANLVSVTVVPCGAAPGPI